MLSSIWQSAASPYIKEAQKVAIEQKFIFQIGTLNPDGINGGKLFIQLIYSAVFHVTRHQPIA